MPPHLPPELWLQIFRVATRSSDHDTLLATTYEPFSTYDMDILDNDLSMKRTLVQVCRQWRALATGILYEDVRLRTGLKALKDTLESSALDGQDYGKRVRRVELPYTSTVTDRYTHTPMPCVEVLKLCPELEVLVRPGPRSFPRHYQPSFEFDADNLPPLSLKRLDWWHHNEAARTGGLNNLDSVLRSAPQIQYLSVGGDLWLGLLSPEPLYLPALDTLRLRQMNKLLLFQICRWSLPSLTHVIADTPVKHRALENLWDAFGLQIRTVELGQNLSYFVTNNISSILARCPNLEELNYYIYFARPPTLEETHESLTCIRLHARGSFLPPEAAWFHSGEHFAVFCGERLPSLKRIILYGDWGSSIADDRFFGYRDELLRRKCVIELSDGTVL